MWICLSLSCWMNHALLLKLGKRSTTFCATVGACFIYHETSFYCASISAWNLIGEDVYRIGFSFIIQWNNHLTFVCPGRNTTIASNSFGTLKFTSIHICFCFSLLRSLMHTVCDGCMHPTKKAGGQYKYKCLMPTV